MEIDKLIASMPSDAIHNMAKSVRSYALKREVGLTEVCPSFRDTNAELVKQILGELDESSHYLRDHLCEKYWPELVFITYFSQNSANRSYLLDHLKSFAITDVVTRGGINLYKVDGWCTHVVMGLYLSNICIPKGEIPATIPNQSPEMVSFFSRDFSSLYGNMSFQSKIIYRVGTLLHDIGVVEGVENHPINGVKYVARALKELGISTKWLKSNGMTGWSLNSFTKAIELFVEYHVFPSSFFGETGIRNLTKTINCMKEKAASADSSGVCTNWIVAEFATCITLFMLGDVASVRDELLDKWKIERTLKSYRAFTSIMEGDSFSADYQEYGSERLCDFLGILTPKSVEEQVIAYNKSEEKGLLILREFGKIERLSYFSGTIKNIPTVGGRITFFHRVMEKCSEHLAWKNAQWKELNFSPDISVGLVLDIADRRNDHWSYDLESMLSFSVDPNISNSTVAKIG